MRGLTLFTAKYAGTCSQCQGPVMRGDTCARLYGRSRSILCPTCTRKARGLEATALDHRLAAARAGRATKTIDEDT